MGHQKQKKFLGVLTSSMGLWIALQNFVFLTYLTDSVCYIQTIDALKHQADILDEICNSLTWFCIHIHNYHAH